MTKNIKTDCTKTILHLIDTTGPGGAETVFIQLADAIRARGFKSIVVIRGPGWVEQELIRKGLTPIILDAKGSFAVGFLKKLCRLIRENNVDVIQSHLLGSNVYAAMAGLLTRTPVVATYHGMVDVNPNERFKGLKNAVMRWGINHYVAVSERLLENIRDQKLLDTRKASVIYNGVDLKRYDKPKSSTLRTTLGLDENAVLVGSLGNIRPAKAYHVLIEAGSILLKENKHVHFVIAGHQKKSLMAQLQQQMEELGVESHFHFLGFCDDCSEFLNQVDLFALSSSSEGFSIATIEAMAAGLPVVVTKCGGPEEILSPNEQGLMVEINNPSALAAALGSLINDRSLQERLVASAKSRVEQSFSLEAMLDCYQGQYDRLS